MKSAPVKESFYLIQLGLVGLAVLLTWIFSRERAQSQFKTLGKTPNDGRPTIGPRNLKDVLLQQRERRARGEGSRTQDSPTASKKPLQLPGIRIHGAPHEILGISASATETEISQAYRELMKQYHPDRIGASGVNSDSPQWKDSQKIAEAINRARQEMMARLKTRHKA